MPPQTLFDITNLDLSKVVYDIGQVRVCNPQRGDMEHLDGILYADASLGRIIGFKDVRDDEFWVPGHIPGRPLLPGVIMIEAAAQLASFYTKTFEKWEGFIGFNGCDEVKFRQAVVPGDRLLLITQKLWDRHHRIGCKTQGWVKGNLAFEATIVGVQM